MKTQNLAIVFTDIEGYTARTSRQTHEENQRMLRVHDALLTPVFRAFGGRPVKTIGDAFLVVFDSPTRAVLCGVAIQDRLWDYNRRVAEDEAIRVRVAVNMGEVRLEKGDVFGEPVNIAARVEGLAEAGEVLYTEAVYLAMNKAEVPAEPYGLHALKGIPDEVKVYRVPHGEYRIQAQGEAPSGPPYGGLGLDRVQGLEEPDPRALEAASELVAHLSAAASGVSASARRLERGLRGGLARITPRTRAALAVGAGAAALAAAALFLLSDPVERAIDRGDLEGARAQIEALAPGPHRTYLAGRVQEAEGHFGRATRRYQRAAKAGEDDAYDRLIDLTRSETCAARSGAAQALGRLGDPDALSALRRLQEGEFEDEGQGGVLGLFTCKSREAAARAIERLEKARN